MEHLAPRHDLPVAPSVALEDIRQRLDVPLGDAGTDAVAVIDVLVKAVEGGIARTTSGRFFGWVIGGALPAALAADWMTSTWDQNAAMYAASPAAAVVEEIAGQVELLQIPASASFAFVTGCQMAHVTCLAVAAMLPTAWGWDVSQEGLSGAPAIRILTSTEKHGTTVRAVRLLGLGERHIEELPVDHEGRLLAAALLAALERELRTPHDRRAASRRPQHWCL